MNEQIQNRERIRLLVCLRLLVCCCCCLSISATICVALALALALGIAFFFLLFSVSFCLLLLACVCVRACMSCMRVRVRLCMCVLLPYVLFCLDTNTDPALSLCARSRSSPSQIGNRQSGDTHLTHVKCDPSPRKHKKCSLIFCLFLLLSTFTTSPIAAVVERYSYFFLVHGQLRKRCETV